MAAGDTTVLLGTGPVRLTKASGTPFGSLALAGKAASGVRKSPTGGRCVIFCSATLAARRTAQCRLLFASPASLYCARPVRLDGLDAETELAGNLLVAEPQADQPDHLRLAIAQVCMPSPRSGRPERLAGDRRIEVDTARGDGPDCPDQVGGGGPLDEVSSRAGLQ
jgi:hypothetical protein